MDTYMPFVYTYMDPGPHRYYFHSVCRLHGTEQKTQSYATSLSCFLTLKPRLNATQNSMLWTDL